MKASTLTDNLVLTAKYESDDFVGGKKLLKKMKTFFAESFESDWEKKTGLLWREWGKRSDMQ